MKTLEIEIAADGLFETEGKVTALFEIEPPEERTWEHPGMNGRAKFLAFLVDGEEIEFPSPFVSPKEIESLEESAFIRWMENNND